MAYLTLINVNIVPVFLDILFIDYTMHVFFFSKMKIQISGIPLHLIVIFSKYNYVCHEYLRKKKIKSNNSQNS